MITYPTVLDSSIQVQTQLRVLYLEDEPNDAELVQATLADAGLACDVVRVDTREAFETTLEQGDFDLILSDKSLPSFDGLSALALARASYPDVASIHEQFTRLRQVPGSQIGATMRYRHTDGSWRWLEGTATNLLAEPSVGAVVLNFRDVTERKQAEAQIARRADEFAALFEISNDLAKQTELATVLRATVERATELLRAPTAGLYLYDEARRDLELIFAKGFRAQPGTRLPLGEGLV